MNFNSKKSSLISLGVTALVCSRAMFAFFNDPEGPNLLIVVVLAAVVYAVSVAAYVYYPSTRPNSLKRLLCPIVLQILLVTGLYFFLR